MSKKALLAPVLLALFLFFQTSDAYAARDKAPVLKTGNSLLMTGKGKKPSSKVKPENLRRLDFRLKGSKCAACLGRVRKRILKLKGVVKVAVSIKKPYGCAVIYDGSKLTKDKILEESLKKETIKMEILDVRDGHLDKMPLILIPVFNQLRDKQ